MDEFFYDINGNKISCHDEVEVLDCGEVVAKGYVTEICLSSNEGIVLWAYEYGQYHRGNAIFIGNENVIPKHFRKIEKKGE